MQLTKLFAFGVLAPISLFAQAPQPPYALFQNATLSGSGNTITVSQVPVVTAVGIMIYVNFTVQFNPDATGNFSVVPGSLQVSLAPAMISSSFKAGTYVSGSNTLSGKGSIVVAGPAVTDGGATVWTLTAATGADGCTYPGNATWYVGPLSTSPYAIRLKAAGLTSTVFSYGLQGSTNCPFNGDPWHANSLLGLTQVGNSITISVFSDQSNKDYPLPVDQITYTLKP